MADAVAAGGRSRRGRTAPPDGIAAGRRRRAAGAARASIRPTAEALAEGVELVRNLLADPPQPPRWPMYLRQIKQFIRTSHPDFDDRKYGSIVDLMRACQKEGLVKLERDRQGGLRVFGAGRPQRPRRPRRRRPRGCCAGRGAVIGQRLPAQERHVRLGDRR